MSRIEEKSVLRARMGEVGELAAKKTLTRLDKYARTYIGHSPFLCIGTADENGRADVSPRGDPPGFVRVIEDQTIIIPDRPGNNRVHTMQNIVANLSKTPGRLRHAGKPFGADNDSVLGPLRHDGGEAAR